LLDSLLQEKKKKWTKKISVFVIRLNL